MTTGLTAIVNGHLIDPASGKDGKFDVLIEGSTIKAIDKPGSFKDLKGIRTVDASNKWVTPGFIDLHVHLREPGYEWKETIESGSKASALGGFTTICCMPNTQPVNDCAEVTGFILEKARAANLVKVLPIGAISIGLHGRELAPYSELVKAGCVAFSDDGEPVWDAGLMRRAIEWCNMHGVPLSCHEEDKNLSCGGCMNESAMSLRMGLKGWHKVAEEVMIARDIELARAFEGRVHICHVSTARGVELIRRAKNDGITITAEVTPHHLTLTEDAVEDYDTNAKMSPPLRHVSDVDALRAGLQDGTLDAVASDHAPHDIDTKTVEFAKASFGILGLQTSLPLLVDLVDSGVITRLRAVESITSAPAKAFNLRAGKIEPGADADLVIVDPKRKWVFDRASILSKSLNSPFLNKELTGAAEAVFVRGREIVGNYKLIDVSK